MEQETLSWLLYSIALQLKLHTTLLTGQAGSARKTEVRFLQALTDFGMPAQRSVFISVPIVT